MFPLLRLIGTAVVVGAGATIGSALAQRLIKRRETVAERAEGPVIDGTCVDLGDGPDASAGQSK